MLRGDEEPDLAVCVYNAVVVRGRVDRGLAAAAQMRVFAYEKGGLWYDASNGEATTEEDAQAAACAFVASKENDSPYFRGRIETKRVRLSRDVPIG